MQKTQSLPDVLHSIPADLPIPMDDGACQHLENMLLPDISLSSTDDKRINLSKLAGWNVIFCYPMTGRPGFSIPKGWAQILGAAGCTPQVCSYRDSHAEFKRNRVGVYGLSSQTPEAQKEAAIRLELPYPLLSDSIYSFSSAMELPILEVDGLRLIKRLTLIIKDGVVRKCFYPVFPPDTNADEVIVWLSALTLYAG
ncbi:peroxiredoxin [Nitrosovibrio sp. Nv6]|uniref:peroxiredoxin n=1 Tax=Nitrosovibrio sp. Nv6 TaxID=1855340 RepID=UPI0008B2B8DB|nr:peroxiredoxin [Nitrosovibrio sp. Nv6]SEP44062.1 Peroxiredoxin [Nitrosovibrio sp. Nv6]